MSSDKKFPVWLFITCIPTLFVCLGITLTTLAYTEQWGGDDKAANVFAIFFAEISIVISAGALLAYYLRIPNKTTPARIISKINWAIVFSAISVGLYLFLG